MALKDWEKRSNNVWYNDKKDSLLEIEKWEEYGKANIGNLLKKQAGYNVSVNNKRNFTIIDKDFKTKSQALRFAKSYMRTH